MFFLTVFVGSAFPLQMGTFAFSRSSAGYQPGALSFTLRLCEFGAELDSEALPVSHLSDVNFGVVNLSWGFF